MEHRPSIDSPKQMERVSAIRALHDLIEEGILPDNTRVSGETKKHLSNHHACALALALDPRSIEYDHRRAMLRFILALGEAGFFGSPARRI